MSLQGVVADLSPEVAASDLSVHMARVTARVDAFLEQMYPASPSPSPSPDSGAGGDSGRELLAATATWDRLPEAFARQVGADLHRSLVAPVRHLLEAGGQRWRSGLVLQTVDALDGDAEACGPLVAGTELMHSGSLVVDDVEDDSPTRRGRPAAHLVFGVSVALNAGTLSYFAFDRAVRQVFADDPHRQAHAYRLYLTALRAAHAGQALDLHGHHRDMDAALRDGSNAALMERVMLTHRLKTGSLEGAVLQIAGVACGAPEPVHQALAAFGTAVGTAYQIRDDIADLYGVIRAGRATKQAGEDLRNARVTMPLVHAVGLLPRATVEQFWHTVRTGGADSAFVASTARQLEECGALTACATQATSLFDHAWQRLRPLLPATPATALLHRMAHQLVHSGLAL